MRLHELLNQITYTTEINGYSVSLTLKEGLQVGVGNLLTLELGTSTRLKNPKYLISKGVDAFVAGAIVAWAQQKLDDYQRSKRYAVKFFAQTGQERSFYKKMVDDLLSTGNYRLVKSTYVNGGYAWQLQRKYAYSY